MRHCQLTDSWPGCAPAACGSQSREALCQSIHFQLHIWNTWSGGEMQKRKKEVYILDKQEKDRAKKKAIIIKW